jgi:hypothetical protein
MVCISQTTAARGAQSVGLAGADAPKLTSPAVIPTLIVVGAAVAALPLRWSLLAVLALGTAWGVLMAATNDAGFVAAFVYGLANAAAGLLLGLLIVGVILLLRGGRGRGARRRPRRGSL